MKKSLSVNYAILIFVVTISLSGLFALSELLFQEDIVSEVCVLCDQSPDTFCLQYFDSEYYQKVWEFGSEEVKEQYLNQCRSKLTYCTFACQSFKENDATVVSFNKQLQTVSIGIPDAIGTCPYIRARRKSAGRWAIEEIGCANE